MGKKGKETSMGGPNEFDVAEAMQEIRRKVREQKQEGPTEPRKVPGTAVVVRPRRLDEAIAGLARTAQEINGRWQVKELPFDSHVPLIGPLIARFREAWNSVACKWHVRRILEQQVQFNRSVAEMTTCVQTLADELSAIDHSIRALVRLFDESLGEQLKDLEGLYRGLVRQLDLGEDRDQETRSEPISEAAVPQFPAFPYRDFARRFGGSDRILRQLYEQYLDFFRGGQRVVDLGCGRGAFLQLLTENGIGAYGVETDSDLVRLCQGKALDVVRADAVEHLRSLDDESLDGIFAGHLVEHLGAAGAWELVGLCYRKLKPGCRLVFETPNTRSLFVLGDMYFRDPTHRLPVHPETWEFVARSQSFSEVQLRFSYPLPEGLELTTIDLEAVDAPLRGQLALLNQNMEKLNQVVFGYQNVAVIAKK
jgi:O-antigen chain-terminating methyltransferase